MYQFQAERMKRIQEKIPKKVNMITSHLPISGLLGFERYYHFFYQFLDESLFIMMKEK